MDGVSYNKKSILEKLDDAPTANSDNAVKSKGVKTYVDDTATTINDNLATERQARIDGDAQLGARITDVAATQTADTFVFKGSVAAVSNLPAASGATIGDTYYVEAEHCNYSCYQSGSTKAWTKSSGTDLSQMRDNIATQWDTTHATKIYKAGDVVMYNDKVYVRKVDATTYDSVWTASEWTQMSVGDQVSNVNNSLSLISGWKSLEYSKGYIACDVDVVDLTNTHPTANYGFLVDNCVEGDVYVINGEAAASAKGWCFINAENRRISYQGTATVSRKKSVTAPAGATKFISNYRMSTSIGDLTPFAVKQVSPSMIRPELEVAISAKYQFGSSIPENADINDYTTPGNFYIQSTSIAATITNLPVKLSGRLSVLSLNTDAAIHQLFISSMGDWYVRELIGGTWRSWKKLSEETKTDSFSTKWINADSIPENVDMNDYSVPGNYYIADTQIASTIRNLPIKLSGRLVVLSLNTDDAVHQLYISSMGDWYVRELVSNEWKAWKKLSETVKTDAISTAWGNAKSIVENENINDYLTPGNYYIASTAIAATISNLPVKLSGRLAVMTLNNSNAVHQIFISSMGDWYVRELIRGEWRGWKRFVDEETVTSLAQNASAAHGAYNAIQALIKNADYDIAFANAYLPLSMQNYLGNTQNVHPKVLYFANGFGGHNYWMAYTPYPYSNDSVENPCVAWSDDGLSWTNIAANPLAESPGGGAYNSDTHLVYRSDTATLECWYRRVDGLDQDPRNETILRRTSTDGINWTEEEVLYVNDSGSYAKILSPAIIWDGSKYCIWAVFGGTRIDYYTAPGNNPGNWTKIRSFEPVISDDGLTVTPWHIDVIKDNGTYVMLMMCRNGSYTENNKWSLFIMTSSDNVTYSAPYKVLNGADNWDRWMYRSSIVKAGNKYRIYYSAGTGGSPRVYNNSVWGLGITESNSLADFIGLYA